jgi:hypothetical protein
VKTFTFVSAGLLLVAVTITPAIAKTGDRHGLARISDETGVSVATLEAQRSATGFGYGELENANLLANASGRSFDEIVAMRQSGQGWGQIAHDLGLNLGRVVSDAHRSDQAALHANNGHSKNASGVEKTHGRSGNAKKKGGPSGGHGHGHGGH